MKKLFALLLAIIFLSTAFAAIPVFAQEDENKPERIFYKELETSPSGYKDYVILDENGNEIDDTVPIVNDGRDRELPSSYDLRNVGGKCYVTSVKDQGNYGTCWSFASVGALESNLIKQGLATTSVDLSELHTAWYAYTPDTVPGSTTYGDGNINTNSDGIYNAGGNGRKAYCLWGSAEGLQTEANAPYSKAADAAFFTETQRKESYYRLKEGYSIPYNDYDAVKSSIMANGALSMSILYDKIYYRAYTASYYNYSNVPDGGGHEILVVGWNDNYAASNFWIPPPGNGAFLCRNSWGTGWGNSGYFWISYYDNWIMNFTVFIGETNSKYDIYNQYEREDFIPSLKSHDIYLSNVFTADAYSRLDAVAFHIDCAGTGSGMPGFDYEIEIYRGDATAYNPIWGTPCPEMTTIGHCNYSGFYTVPLSAKIVLNAGNKYAVVIHFTSTLGLDGRIWYGGESYPDEENPIQSGINSCAGRSFWSVDGSTFVDTYGDAELYGYDLDGNFPIKALTYQVEKHPERAKIQEHMDQCDGCTQGTATSDQWTAFTAARTVGVNILANTTACKADLDNANIRLIITRDNAPGISYPTSPDFILEIDNRVATITSYVGTATTVKIPKALNGCTLAVGATAFNGNTSLKVVYVEKDLASFATTAFAGCTDFKYIYFFGNAPKAISGTIGPEGPTGVLTYYHFFREIGFTGNSLWGGTSRPVVPGDFNADAEVNMTDAVKFVQRLAQSGSYSDYEYVASEITRDGVVNMADLVKLVQALANPSMVLQ